jgi:hypothetical protein
MVREMLLSIDSSRMLQRLVDTVVLTVVAILFSVAVAVLKYRRI